MRKRLLALLLAILSVFAGILPFQLSADAETVCYDTSDEILSEEGETSLPKALSSGEYFIRNVGTNRYLDVENQNIANGAKLCQWRFKGRASQKWTLTSDSDGYFTITKKVGSTKYYMGVQGDQTGSNVQIILRTGAVTGGMKWKITQTAQGHFKLTAKVSHSVGRVLGVGANQTNTDGAYIKQRGYVNDSNYRDEWEIIGKNGAALMASTGGKDNHYDDHIATFPAVEALLSEILFTPVVIKKNTTKIRFMELMASSKIIYFRGHGEQRAIHPSGTQQVSFGDIQTLSSGALDYVKLVLYGSCYTGRGRFQENNMVNITRSKGAKTVIGFTVETNCEEVNFWCNEFFIGLNETRNISAALDYARERTEREFLHGRTTDYPHVNGYEGKLYSY